jgi:hypothetical protein
VTQNPLGKPRSAVDANKTDVALLDVHRDEHVHGVRLRQHKARPSQGREPGEHRARAGVEKRSHIALIGGR